MPRKPKAAPQPESGVWRDNKTPTAEALMNWRPIARRSRRAAQFSGGSRSGWAPTKAGRPPDGSTPDFPALQDELPPSFGEAENHLLFASPPAIPK